MGIIGKKGKKEERAFEIHELISSSEVEMVRKSLIETNAQLVVLGMVQKESREELSNIIRRNHEAVVKGNQDVIDYIVRETIGTGVIEEILLNPDITDVGYNGSELIVETNNDKFTYDTNFEITEDYITRIVQKFANTNQKDFTSKSPIFDGRFENIRINAVHTQNTAPESGTTMSLRVVRPKLALTRDNFNGFAPMFIADLFEKFALTKSNMVISGTTGTGKTELHKFISSYIPFNDRIILIEDTPETFLKQMFPEKDIYSWVTSEVGGVNVTKMIKAGLRNHPVWLMVTETRGDEAYEMIQAVLSGQAIMTSLHAVNARAIPARLVNMAKMGYQLDEAALLDDIRRYFDYGIHIKKVRLNGRVIRYLSEIVYFDPDGDTTIFSQRLVGDAFSFETGELPISFEHKLEELGLTVDFPEKLKATRPLDLSNATFEYVIPLDASGRPDLDRIQMMGTTLDDLLGRGKRRPVATGNEKRIATDTDGFVKLGSKPSDAGSEQANRVDELKKQVAKSGDALPQATPRTDAVRPKVDQLKGALPRTPPPERQAKVRPVKPVTDKPVEKSAKELFAEKRRQMRKEDF